MDAPSKPVDPSKSSKSNYWKWVGIVVVVLAVVSLIGWLVWPKSSADPTDPTNYMKSQFTESGSGSSQDPDDMEIFAQLLQPTNREQFKACPNKTQWTDEDKLLIVYRAMTMGLRELAQGFATMPSNGVSMDDLRTRGMKPELQKYTQQMATLMLVYIRLFIKSRKQKTTDFFVYNPSKDTVQFKGDALKDLREMKDKLKLNFDVEAPLPMDVFVPLLIYTRISMKSANAWVPPGYNECSICDPGCSKPKVNETTSGSRSGV